jgi:hypothetical protein
VSLRVSPLRRVDEQRGVLVGLLHQPRFYRVA